MQRHSRKKTDVNFVNNITQAELLPEKQEPNKCQISDATALQRGASK